MTQDQSGQARDSGYVRGDVVTDDETEEFPASQAKPMTRFQKVASALRGNAPDQAGADQAGADQAGADQAGADQAGADQAGADQAAPDHAAATGREAARGDYRDDEANRPATGQDEVVAVTSPDVPVTDTAADPLTRPDEVAGQARPDAEDHPMTQPDIFGTTVRPGIGDTSASYQDSRGQADGVTISDVAATEAPGAAGRHAAARADTELRPGEAAGTLGDLSDITFGNLITDAGEFRSQWHQIQFRFVDDPRGSVTEAADVIAQVTARLEAAIQERQRVIQERQRSLRGRWGEGTNADTETLRETLLMYRAFLDQLIRPRV
jgi:hypothetical protein